MKKIFPCNYDVKPFFVNENGWEWYENKTINECCVSDHINAPILQNVKGFTVRRGYESSYILVNDKQEILFDTMTLEAMFVHIDILRLAIES